MKVRILQGAVLALCAALGACDGTSTSQQPEDDTFHPDPLPESRDFAVTLTVAEAQVPLGGDLVFRVKVENRGKVATDLNLPRLSRDSVSLRFRGEAGEVVWLNPIPCRETDRGPQPDPGEIQSVGPGESVGGEIRVTAVLPGKFVVGATYVCQSLASDPIVAQTVPIEVTTAAGARLAVKLETNQGTIEARLRPDIAFQTVTSFATLVKKGFYDGLGFHRVVRGFMAQGGDPTGKGWGGPGYMLPLERHGKLAHRRGVLSMARQQAPDTAGSQFFLMFRPDPNLDSLGYTTFGEMTSGNDTLQRIEALGSDAPDGGNQAPREPVTITKATLQVIQ